MSLVISGVFALRVIFAVKTMVSAPLPALQEPVAVSVLAAVMASFSVQPLPKVIGGLGVGVAVAVGLTVGLSVGVVA